MGDKTNNLLIHILLLIKYVAADHSNNLELS